MDYEVAFGIAQRINEHVSYEDNGVSSISCGTCGRMCIWGDKRAAFDAAEEGWIITIDRKVGCNYCVKNGRAKE